MAYFTYADVRELFYNYILQKGNMNEHSCQNCRSRLDYWSELYIIDSNLTEERIAEIADLEVRKLATRTKYKTNNDVADLKKELRRFLEFVGVLRGINQINTSVAAINQDTTITQTEKDVLIKARTCQGLFRTRLIDYWGACAVTGVTNTDLLVASHIVPWQTATDEQRVDVNNGLLLTPNFDKLFDRHLMTFDDDGNAIYSPKLSATDLLAMGIKGNEKLLKMNDDLRVNLAEHRKTFIAKNK